MNTFQNYCNCGGYACSMNGRDPEHPHMTWCAQYTEWEQFKKVSGGVKNGELLLFAAGVGVGKTKVHNDLD